MISVTYYRDLNRLVMEGHANAGEKGQDPVCAAASMLAYTLAANVEELTETGKVRDPLISMKEGDTVIACNPLRRYRTVVTSVFDSVILGFQVLAMKYPKNISFKIFRGRG